MKAARSLSCDWPSHAPFMSPTPPPPGAGGPPQWQWQYVHDSVRLPIATARPKSCFWSAVFVNYQDLNSSLHFPSCQPVIFLLDTLPLMSLQLWTRWMRKTTHLTERDISGKPGSDVLHPRQRNPKRWEISHDASNFVVYDKFWYIVLGKPNKEVEIYVQFSTFLQNTENQGSCTRMANGLKSVAKKDRQLYKPVQLLADLSSWKQNVCKMHQETWERDRNKRAMGPPSSEPTSERTAKPNCLQRKREIAIKSQANSSFSQKKHKQNCRRNKTKFQWTLVVWERRGECSR